MKLLLLLYLIGIVLCYGLYIGAMYKLELDKIDKEEPTYEMAHHDMVAYIICLFSWFGVIAITIAMSWSKRVPVIKYSYKKLWRFITQKQNNDSRRS